MNAIIIVTIQCEAKKNIKVFYYMDVYIGKTEVLGSQSEKFDLHVNYSNTTLKDCWTHIIWHNGIIINNKTKGS